MNLYKYICGFHVYMITFISHMSYADIFCRESGSEKGIDELTTITNDSAKSTEPVVPRNDSRKKDVINNRQKLCCRCL